MTVVQSIEHSGAFLFRWRSYGPLILLPVLFAALPDAATMKDLVGSHWHERWAIVCLAISICGLAIRWIAVAKAPPGTSGRSVSVQQARVLNTTALYLIVRHPLYLGNFIVLFGISLSLMVWYIVVVTVLFYWLYIERILAVEEAYLSKRTGGTFSLWATDTPAFIPKFTLWKASARTTSVKTVLKREFYGLLAVTTTYAVLDFMLHVVVAGEDFVNWLRQEPALPGVFVLSLVIFCVLRWMK